MAQSTMPLSRANWSARLGACSAIAFAGAVGVWAIQGHTASGGIKVNPEDAVGLVSSGNGAGITVTEVGKAPLLSICGAVQMSVNLGEGVKKYDLSQGSGMVEHDCPFGARNLQGKMRFECKVSGMWEMATHNCYQCQGLEAKLKIQTHVKQVDLPFGERGETQDFDCKFPGQEYPHGKVSFSCGLDHKWTMVEASCSNNRCPSSSIHVRQKGNLPANRALNLHANSAGNLHANSAGTGSALGTNTGNQGKDYMLTVASDNDYAIVKCPAGGEMNFVCQKFDHQVGEPSYHWQATSVCDNIEFPHVEGWCPGRTASLDMKQNWDTKREKNGKIQLAPAPFGTYKYKCPHGSFKPDGTVLFECKDYKWSIVLMDCVGENITVG